MRQVDVPVVLSFVDDHRKHLSHGGTDTPNSTVAVGMVGPRREFPCTACDSLEQDRSPILVRRLAGHHQRGMHVLTKMSAVPSVVNSAAETASSEHIREKRNISASAQKSHEEWNVGASPRFNEEGAEAVDTHRDTRAGRQGEKEDGPTHRLAGRRSRLVLETTATACRCVDANPPIKAFERASGTEVVGGGCMARFINTRMHLGSVT